jgi:SAM-dependent methyltransferase
MDRAGGYQDSAFVAELYDQQYQMREDIGFWIEEAQASGGPVLEVACGTGRVLIPTARAGIEITGLDLAEPMLNMCRERLAEEPEEVQKRARLVQADMRRFELQETYGLITVPYRSFQHLTTVEDQLSCLRCLHHHLASGGRLILDLLNPSVHFLAREVTGKETPFDQMLDLPDGRHVQRAHRLVSLDLHEQLLHSEQIYYVNHPDGRQERLVHAYDLRYLYRYEAEHLLARCEFELEQVYADFDRQPYGSVYPGELILIARRRTNDE